MPTLGILIVSPVKLFVVILNKIESNLAHINNEGNSRKKINYFYYATQDRVIIHLLHRKKKLLCQ